MYRLFKIMAGLLCSLIIMTAAAYANSGAWQIIEMTGTVRTVQPAAGMQLVSTGDTLGAGSVLTTGMNGRVALMRGEQQIVIGPNSRMSLPQAQEPGMTRILQDFGTLLFKVDKRDKQHFRVETPVIAAVVKGTTFTVSAGVDSHAVHVAEGAVEVSSMNGRSHELVTAGLTARISPTNPSVIEMSSGNTRRKTDRDRAPDATKKNGELTVPTKIGAEPLEFAKLTDGLVRPTKTAASAVTPARITGDMMPGEKITGGNEKHGKYISELRRNATNNGAAANRNSNVVTASVDALEHGDGGKYSDGKGKGSDNSNSGSSNSGNASGNSNSGNSNGNSGSGNNGNANGNDGKNSGKGNANSNSSNSNGNSGSGNNGAANGNDGRALGNDGKNSDKGAR